MTFIYEIPKNIHIVLVSDFFSYQLTGGAELTTAAIFEKCPYKYFEINSHQVTQDLVEKNKDKYWVICNCANLSLDAIKTLVVDKIKYSIIAYDYFYCRFRSKHLHKIQTGKDCDCNITQHGKFVYGFYKNADHVFFMSHEQMNEWKRVFPPMNNWQNKLHVQGSTFSDETIEFLQDLYKNKKQHNNKWAILKGGSWIKAEKETVEYCRNTNKNYELIGGLDPKTFLVELSNYKGLVFHPAGYDTAPRLVIEAACLGLELDLNENVQIKDEEWLKKSPDDLINYLKTQKTYIWEKIKL